LCHWQYITMLYIATLSANIRASVISAFLNAICLIVEICQMPKDEGLCTGNNSRWYFDPQVEACLEFLYSGCRGNRNNFLTHDQCESVCKKYKGM
jgi:hypothetical protein